MEALSKMTSVNLEYLKANSPMPKTFPWHEATVSSTAEQRGITNLPQSEATIRAIQHTASQMVKVREILGNNPVIVNSWFRSSLVNKLVGGVVNSSHMSGYAVDFHCPRYGSPTAICRKLKDSGLKYDQLIWEYGKWVHISFAPAMRQETLYIENARIGYRLGLPT